MPSVILSYSWADKDRVKKIAEWFKAKGVSVWVNDAEINIGDSLIDKIGQAIHEVDYVAVFLSRNSVSSNWVQQELKIAIHEIRENRVVILPVLLEDVEIPIFLQMPNTLYADFRTPDAEKLSLERLVRTLGIQGFDSKEIEDVSERQVDSTMIFQNSTRPVSLRPADRDVSWNYDEDLNDYVRTPYRGDALYHIDGEIYWEGDEIEPAGLFFADGTPATNEDLYFLYRWAHELG